jgi:Carboxypeptidase regulatory-like domain/TonB dependent receptor-like, beta-barrel
MRVVKLVVAFGSITLLFAALPAVAQTTFATITGTVTDSTGAIVPGVTLTATHVATNVQVATQSNEAGLYTLTQLKEGEYILRAQLPGFKEFVAKDIVLTPRDMRRMDIQLEVGGVAESIEVSAGATLIETETARINDTRTAYELKTLPLNTRGIWAYLSITPSILQRAGGSTISFAGSRGNQSQWAIDGTTMSDGVGETQIGPLANFIESFNEVKIDMANNSAEFGTLGNVTIVSKSGTNDFHGAVFDYYQSPFFRTRNPFASERATGVSHNIGFAAGGPIVLPKIYNGKNRTFFFMSAETFTGSQATAQLNPTVPLESWRRGDFSALGVQIRNPFTNEVYADGRIPSSAVNPVARRIQERFYPLPNFGDTSILTSNNYREILPRPFDTPYYMVGRIDQKIGNNDSVFARYTVNQQKVGVWEGNLPSFGPRRQFRRNKALTAVYSHTFSPTLLNEVRFGHTFNNNPLEGPLNGPEVIRDLGIQGLAPNLPDIGGVFKVGFTGVGLTGISQIDWRRPGFLNKIQQFQDQVSFFRGKHGLRMGVEIRKVRWDDAAAPANLFGNVTFANTYTRVPNVTASGHPYADFLFGVPTSASRAFPPVLVERSRWMYEYFLQDDWKLSSRLTLNLGVRYEYHPVWEEDNGRQAMFDVVSGKIAVDDRGISLLSPLIPPGYVDIVKASDLGLPSRTLVRGDKNNIAPRFGLAYKPFSGNDTVLRAGYGIYYDTTPINPSAGGSPFVINEPGFTNTTPAPSLVLPQAFPATGTGGPSTIGLPAAINPDLKMPYSQQWNLTIEHQHWATGFRVSYIGTNTRQMQYDYNINAPVVDERLFIDKPRRFPLYPGISYFDNGANHNYHGFTIEAERKLSGGLYFQSGYTWARDIGDQRDGSIENPYDRRRERAVDQTIPTHRFTNALIYQLPWGQGRHWLASAPRPVDLALGGWEISMVAYHQTGMFLTPTISVPDPTGTAFTASANRPLITIRPDQLRDPNVDNPNIDRWFDPSAFGAPPIGRFGNAARGQVIGPGTNVFHVGFHKYFTFSENPNVPRFRIELTSTNFFNHPNWVNPDVNLSSAGTVATIRNVGSPNNSSTGDQAANRSLRLGFRAEW